MIIDLQRRIQEIGRLRIGQQVPIGKTGKTRPAKLETWRFTSANEQAIRQAAKLYGGTVAPWQAPAGNQFEVITETTTLPILLPPTDIAFSQHYEKWAAGGCERRCDGVNETISDGPCLCDPEQRECNIHTRLSVLLSELIGVGVWRVDTQGYYAAVELQGAVDLLQTAARAGTMLPAQLRLEQRMVKRPGQTTRRFAVPVLDVEITPAQLIGGTPPRIDPTPPQAINGSAPLTPVPDSDPDCPDVSIADQIAPPPPVKRRGQIPIKATGLAPRTATQAQNSPQPKTEVTDPRWPTPLPADVINTLDAIDAAHEAAEQNPDQLTLDEPGEIRMATPDQLKKIAVLLRTSGFDDHETRHAFVSAAIGHPYDKPNELTLDEASNLIDVLENDRGATDDET